MNIQKGSSRAESQRPKRGNFSSFSLRAPRLCARQGRRRQSKPVKASQSQSRLVKAGQGWSRLVKASQSQSRLVKANEEIKGMSEKWGAEK
jgi:hypothetical protein